MIMTCSQIAYTIGDDMIRTKTKIYGEANHPDTCTTTETMTTGKCIVTDNISRLTTINTKRQGILMTDANGRATFFPVPEGPEGANKLLATNGESLIWIDR